MAVSLTFAGTANGGSVLGGAGATTTQLKKVTDDPDLQGRDFKSAANRVSSANIEATSIPVIKQPIDKAAARTTFATGLSGTYTIPGSFPSLSSAVSVLNFVGVSGDVVFELGSTSYTELTGGVTFGSYPGNATYSVTVRPAAGVAATISFQATASEGKGIAFNGAKHVTIDGVDAGGASLTLTYSGGTYPAGDAFGATVYITGGSDHIAIRKTNIEGQIVGPYATQTEGRPAVFVWFGSADPAGNSNITVDSCTITKATYGIKALCEALVASGPMSFTHNKIGGAYGEKVNQAALTDAVSGLHYDYNTVDGIEFNGNYWNNGPTEYDLVATFGGSSFLFDFGQPSGGHFYNSNAGSTIAYNVIKSVQQPYGDAFAFIIYGMLCRVGSGPVMHDNRIIGPIHTTDTDGTMVGIRSECQVFHNSIRMIGTQLTTQTSYGFRMAGGSAKNNAVSNEMTGGTASRTRALQGTPAGVTDGNAYYSNGQISTQSTLAGYLATGRDANSAFGPINFTSDLHITAGPSTAEGVGLPKVYLAPDVDGDVRDTTVAGSRDAGADDFAPTGSPMAIDALPVAITAPTSAGVPVGLAQTPVVLVKNNSAVPQTFNVTLTESGETYTDTKPITIAAHGSGSVSFATWMPTTVSAHTFTATTALAGDATPSNDVLSRAQSVSAPEAITTSRLWNWDASADGWTGTVDWKRLNNFTKLSGPYSGYSWVTANSVHPESYAGGADAIATTGFATTYPGANILTSAFLDLSGMTGDSMYISFFQSIKAEVQWDISWMEYTTDGVNWHHLGHLNDPKGVNWYNESVYKYAAAGSGNPPDTVTMNLYGLMPGGGNDQTALLDFPNWSSNGDPSDAVPTGPNGYVFNQLKINLGDYPGLIHAPIVKFRYIAFSDASTTYEGWAVDNFRIGNTGTVLGGGSITGHAYQDNNGNGVDDAEPFVTAGTKVYLSYFGALKDSTVIDPSGNYSFNIGTSNASLPGVYNVRLAVPGVGFTVPFGSSGIADVNHPSDGTTKVQNFGTYVGSISGMKFNDVNDNGVNDSEPGLAGWTIEVHKDSANGSLVGSTVTPGSGAYSFNLPPATYVVKEVHQNTISRQTAPVGGTHTVTISGASGSGTAVYTGKDFGNFIYYKLRINLTVDINGDGIVGGGDVLPLPSIVGTISVFTTKKNGTPIFVDTLGNGVGSVIHDSLDVGTYDVVETAFTPGWIRTKGGTFTHVVASSSVLDTARFMDFKLITISGKKFKDVNGNGVDDSEPGLAGWTINVSGNALGATSAVTDSLGFYTIDSVSTGLHNITETPVVGWTQTLPATNYSFTAVSGNLPNPVTGRDFGNFENYSISGQKYIDRNNDGTKDPEDNGLSGWTINLNPGALTAVTDANGDYTFTNVGPGAKTLSETTQPGWYQSAPVGGTYVINGISGTNVTGQDFGNFKATDSTAYRTFTAAQLQADNQKKPAAYKAGKPILAGPNTANLLKDLFAQGAVIKVGLSGQMNAGGKEKAYIQPAKYSDVWKGLNAKSVFHTGTPRGLDLDVKGKLLLKRFKALPPTKKNNSLIANLIALQVNLAASGLKTPAGLGALMYSDAGHPFNGWSIDSIATYADGVMTNWEGTPYGVYVMLDSVAAKINGAFASGVVDDTTATGGFTSAKLQWKAYTAVMDVPFLKATGNQAKSRIAPVTIESLPAEYALSQNYPNPFNPTTTIQFDLPNQSMVTLKIYNMLGQEVATLLNREEVAAGQEELEFDASSLASGVYLYRIVAESVNDDGAVSQTFTQVKKMVLLK
jgi:hypothetical protein